MQKVFIKGVQGRGKEVIAKLEALGGVNTWEYGGEEDAYFYITAKGEIDFTGCPETQTLFNWVGTEIFLDEPVEEQKSVNTLKRYDPVMCSDNGKEWYIALYKNGFSVFNDVNGNGFATCKYKYIVPHSDFDFNDLESNIKRSVV